MLRPFWEFIHWWNWRLNLLCTESTYLIVIDTPSWLSCVCSVYVLLSRRLPPTTRELWLTPGHNWPSHQSISLTNLSSQPFRSRHKRRFYVKIDLYQDISNILKTRVIFSCNSMKQLFICPFSIFVGNLPPAWRGLCWSSPGGGNSGQGPRYPELSSFCLQMHLHKVSF